MDSTYRKFIGIALFGIISILFLLTSLGAMYLNFSIYDYAIILKIIIMAIIFMLAWYIFSVVLLAYVYKRGKVNKLIKVFIKVSLKMLMPSALLMAKAIKADKDIVSSFYIKVNNILVESCNYRVRASDILVILPHCLQNSGCNIKITTDINSCKICGKCIIGDICKLAKDKGVKVVVATGGTLARNMIKQNKPKLIVAVACERDLSSGISDIVSLPVLGILNKRPNGPCLNTVVDVRELREKLDKVLIR